MVYIVYNPEASNNSALDAAKKVIAFFGNRDMNVMTVHEVGNELEFCKKLEPSDTFVLIGGNGTLFHFINSLYGEKLNMDFFYYPSGAGSDFSRDIRFKDQNPDSGLIKLNHYIEHLPVCTIEGKKYYFANGVGVGIDGYVCARGNELREKTDKEINYTNIAIGGMIGKYHPSDCTITIDGKVSEYKSVWLVPTMIGRFIGGGMLIAPQQNRFNPEKTVTTIVWHTKNPLATLMNFPKVFSGEHLDTNLCDSFTGHHVNIKFTKPQDLQIDGESFKNISEYSVDYE